MNIKAEYIMGNGLLALRKDMVDIFRRKILLFMKGIGKKECIMVMAI